VGHVNRAVVRNCTKVMSRPSYGGEHSETGWLYGVGKGGEGMVVPLRGSSLTTAESANVLNHKSSGLMTTDLMIVSKVKT
jgi:hypothetical protein